MGLVRPSYLALAALGLVALADPVQPDQHKHNEERAQVIAEINSRPGVLWKAAPSPRFAGLPVGASQRLCGVKPGGVERLRARVAAGTLGFVPKRLNVSLPERFDSAEHWPECAKVIGDVRDQSDCGCCWAFGAAEAASDRLCIATKGAVAVPLSAEETCFCAERAGCDGGELDTAWSYIGSKGLVTGGQYKGTGPFGGLGLCSAFSLPHCHHHGPQGDDPYPAEGTTSCPSVESSPRCPAACDATAKPPYDDFGKDRYLFSGEVQYIESDADTIAEQIMKHGPVEAAFTVYSDFENYATGIYHKTSHKALGGHAIKIVGWGVEGGVKYWKVQNSWNPYWGEGGYFRIVRGADECGIESQVVANSPSSRWVGPGAGPGAEIVV